MPEDAPPGRREPIGQTRVGVSVCSVLGYHSETMADPATPFLDSEQAEFICAGVSISAASCRIGSLPSLARGIGCRLSPDRRTATVLFAEPASAGLLEDVRRSGLIAVVFSRPVDHRTLQVKASDAMIVPVEAGDAELAAHYVDTFVTGLEALGYPGAPIRAFLASPPEDLVAVRFTPSEGFSQTPGPEAGKALRSGA